MRRKNEEEDQEKNRRIRKESEKRDSHCRYTRV